MYRALEYEDIVEVVNINTIEELREKVIYDDKLKKYLYRGHSKSESYKLVPTLLRLEEESAKERRYDFYIKELRSLLQFYLESNKIGLYVPNIPSFFQFGVANKFDLSLVLKEMEWNWLSNEVIELAALAQHYGMHTRLLDWTQDIRVALYFAASGVEESQKEDMAIWCINAGELTDIREVFDTSNYVANILSYDGQGDHSEKWDLIRILNEDVLSLRFFIPHYDANININAQKGVLSIWQYNLGQKEIYKHSSSRKNIRNIPHKDALLSESVEMLRKKIGDNGKEFLEQSIERDTRPLDKLILDYFDQNNSKRCKIKEMSNKILYKFVIKKELRNDILYMLCTDGYNRAKIYPGYHSVAEMIMNHEV